MMHGKQKIKFITNFNIDSYTVDDMTRWVIVLLIRIVDCNCKFKHEKILTLYLKTLDNPLPVGSSPCRFL